MPMQLLPTATAWGGRASCCAATMGGAVSTLATLRLMATAERGSAAERKLSLRCFAFGPRVLWWRDRPQRTAAPGLANNSNCPHAADIVPFALRVRRRPPQRNGNLPQARILEATEAREDAARSTG